MPFNKITLVGVGLLGGSLALAIRERGLAGVVMGYVRREASLAECAQAGLPDFATLDLLAAVRDADLVILCTPLAQMRELTERMLPALKRGAIVSDVGSVKAGVVRDLEPRVAVSGAEFIGAHPMAGGEKMGVTASRADLFENAVCVLTPTERTGVESLEALAAFWRAVGSRVLRMPAGLHDDLVARCSHLPHVVAAAVAAQVLDPELPKEQPALCANGFRDTTRIASSSPEMWRDIALANRENLAGAIGILIQNLERVRVSIERGDGAAVEKFFGMSKQRRDAWRAQTVPPSPSPE